MRANEILDGLTCHDAQVAARAISFALGESVDPVGFLLDRAYDAISRSLGVDGDAPWRLSAALETAADILWLVRR